MPSVSVADRFMQYVQIDTQSNPQSNTVPTTEKQRNLSSLLAEQLKQIGVKDVMVNEYGYVYATIPSNSSKDLPVLCFCAHIDTAPDCSGTHVKPILHKNYQGQSIVLPEDTGIVLDPEKMPYLNQHIGKDIISASGTTLLGADDKAGVAIIMTFAEIVCSDDSILHGEIKILFTPDEEVGRGTNHLDMELLGADFAYTLDGGELGTFEDETFSANGFSVNIEGVIAHPGYAKGRMVNAIKLAAEIIAALPKDRLAPEVTDKKQGFVHPVQVEGTAEKARIDFIIRDFDTNQLKHHQAEIIRIAHEISGNYPGVNIHFAEEEQYRNMKEVIDRYPYITEFAKEAYTNARLPFVKEPIRGGTDGSRLSFMGLPCPNIFTGMQAIHSKKEWVGVYDMEKAVEVLVNLVKVWEEKGENLHK
ncbi:peptidase T [Sediminibacterium salmoneum]|uniref:peptidase T n=1 Tax=Sediminibacterium salmoneum TaxID=426421 RepID=UPI00047CA371|nr:peptidase T [Sediminibacterium salmoneum]